MREANGSPLVCLVDVVYFVECFVESKQPDQPNKRNKPDKRGLMDFTTALGLLAGTLTTIAFLPQVIRTWKSKSTKDLSLAMLGTFTTGVFCWLIYGLMIDSLPIILANAVTFLLAGANVVLKLRYG
jgi:MtN3 and saliva related transmembrane protein